MFPQQSPTQAPPGQRLVAERRWRLGVHSRGHPHRIIEDLLRALHTLSVGYKKVAPYNYKCRKLYPARGISCRQSIYKSERSPGLLLPYCLLRESVSGQLTDHVSLCNQCSRPYISRGCMAPQDTVPDKDLQDRKRHISDQPGVAGSDAT